MKNSNATAHRERALFIDSSLDNPRSVAPQGRLRHIRGWVFPALEAVAYAALLGLLVNFGNQGKSGFIPGGYNAGNSDHIVLSTLGIHWADPTKFAGDWFMNASPQPHWFFDLLTYVGASSNNLGIAYFIFWLCGLLCFGLATALLSRHWMPKNHWFLGASVTFVIALAPWNSVGTGNALIAFAVPAVVGGHMVFLFLALANTGHSNGAAFLAPLIAVVHVQQGAVICVLLVALILVMYRVEADTPGRHRIWWAGIASLFVTASTVIFGLTLRPVASKLEDFVEICDVMIPYHCAAHQWSLQLIYSSLALIVLAGLTVFYVDRNQRMLWLASVGLPCIGLVTGLLMDSMRVPILGALFQATNVYRLGAVVFPFAIFGIFVGLARAQCNWRGVLVAQTSFVCTFLYLGHYGWQLDEPTSLRFIMALLLVNLIVLLVVARPRFRGSHWPASFGLVAFVGLFAANAIAANALTPRPLNVTFISDSTLRGWGQRVEALVPSGEQLLAAPQWTIKTPTSRGVIADCKNVPYGGAAWLEWQKRINELGGIDQCRPPYTQTFTTMSAQQLDTLATQYSIRFAVLDKTQARTFDELEQLGWRQLLGPSANFSLYLWAKGNPSSGMP